MFLLGKYDMFSFPIVPISRVSLNPFICFALNLWTNHKNLICSVQNNFFLFVLFVLFICCLFLWEGRGRLTVRMNVD